MTEPAHYRRVNAARVQADLSVQQLWLRYVSLSGLADPIDIDAYLHGMVGLPPYQEDKLSYAVNERLDELHQQARVPYTGPLRPAPAVEDPLEVLRDLVHSAGPGERAHPVTRQGGSFPPSGDASTR